MSKDESKDQDRLSSNEARASYEQSSDSDDGGPEDESMREAHMSEALEIHGGPKAHAHTEVGFLTHHDMVEAGRDIADEFYNDLIDPLEDVELSGAARERIDWARGELWERLGWLTGWVPQEGADRYDDWLAELPRILDECRYCRNVVRREVLRARGYDVPDTLKAPCHHEEDRDSAVLH